MIALDTTFLIDYLDGVTATAKFLERQSAPIYYAPALVLYEVYEGAALYDGDSIEKAQTSLDWIEPLEFDHGVSREAAQINAELLEAGQPINHGDVLIAGTCRHHGAALVTRDEHFEAIDGLETVSY
ncbi:twitching motility protein PilT [Halostagnicola larsenii XH-48]|uniref:Ribonuclease VapC n=1 Tax=Halostagnicola larsenii XH-48 TaxID=797299 RepID=W0JI90_9EURY|nr:type II toxin-antitoxin system VapC family toxin [Halostagnicola larsenii]AHF98303.1 twitching motility protein PilT [Halostagnicola larsenii XH-48]